MFLWWSPLALFDALSATEQNFFCWTKKPFLLLLEFTHFPLLFPP
ncbi:MAG: hypothetical protein MRECE_47c002 [Mycoplasmataceae bacterium CE_OT135]|nr:MAG: hypothetical protein MRECE_47c002 [Mycoplasmataceae bacterium CE_OT135]